MSIFFAPKNVFLNSYLNSSLSKCQFSLHPKMYFWIPFLIILSANVNFLCTQKCIFEFLKAKLWILTKLLVVFASFCPVITLDNDFLPNMSSACLKAPSPSYYPSPKCGKSWRRKVAILIAKCTLGPMTRMLCSFSSHSYQEKANWWGTCKQQLIFSSILQC